MVVRKQGHNGTSRRKNYIAVCGALYFEGTVELSQDTLCDECHSKCQFVLSPGILRKEFTTFSLFTIHKNVI